MEEVRVRRNLRAHLVQMGKLSLESVGEAAHAAPGPSAITWPFSLDLLAVDALPLPRANSGLWLQD